MTDVVPPIAPAAPSTPAEAVARLTALKQDVTWTKSLLDGGVKQTQEFHNLHALAAKGDNAVALAMAGQHQPGIVQDSQHIEMMGAAKWLQEAGIGPEVVKQVLTNQPVTRDEFEKAARAKSMLMNNLDFSKKLMANDGEAKSNWKLLNIILSSDVKQDDAR